MIIKNKLGEFLRRGKTFIGHTKESSNEIAFAKALKDGGYGFREDKIVGGSWFYHETTLKEHSTEVSPGVRKVDTMSLFGALRTY